MMGKFVQEVEAYFPNEILINRESFSDIHSTLPYYFIHNTHKFKCCKMVKQINQEEIWVDKIQTWIIMFLLF